MKTSETRTLLITAILIVLLVGCKPVSTSPSISTPIAQTVAGSTATRAPITLTVNTGDIAFPQGIFNVWPYPNSKLTMPQYEDNMKAAPIFAGRGIGVEFDIQKDWGFTKYVEEIELYPQRAVLFVNGIQIPNSTLKMVSGDMGYYGWDGIAGKYRTFNVGPFYYSWTPILKDHGEYTAVFIFLLPNNEVFSYSWEFSIIEDK